MFFANASKGSREKASSSVPRPSSMCPRTEQVQAEQPRRRRGQGVSPERGARPLDGLAVEAPPFGGGGEADFEQRIPRSHGVETVFEGGERAALAREEIHRAEGGEDLGGVRQFLCGEPRQPPRLVAVFLLQQSVDGEGPRRRMAGVHRERLLERIPFFQTRRRPRHPLPVPGAGGAQQRPRMAGVVPQHRLEAFPGLGGVVLVEQQFARQQPRQGVPDRARRPRRRRGARRGKDPHSGCPQPCGGLSDRGKGPRVEGRCRRLVVGGDHAIESLESGSAFPEAEFELSEKALRLDPPAVRPGRERGPPPSGDSFAPPPPRRFRDGSSPAPAALRCPRPLPPARHPEPGSRRDSVR